MELSKLMVLALNKGLIQKNLLSLIFKDISLFFFSPNNKNKGVKNMPKSDEQKKTMLFSDRLIFLWPFYFNNIQMLNYFLFFQILQIQQ